MRYSIHIHTAINKMNLDYETQQDLTAGCLRASCNRSRGHVLDQQRREREKKKTRKMKSLVSMTMHGDLQHLLAYLVAQMGSILYNTSSS